MALETCFRAWALHAAPAGGKDRLAVGSSFAPSKRAAAAPLSVGRVATRRPRHVCQSKNAVDEVLVNTDDCPNVASTYGIRSIPTVLIFKGGEKKESVIGAVPKTTLTTIVDKYIGSSGARQL
ncbi:hypothetical protein PVAP13_3KG056800 [Panicum virgatum]|uniref:Thioredoxin domain-containing protein n=1 Tax=Panicum virgatum TaxID=38727 RepID=A0A8T0URD2_PANVG|nr:hypothetical protein PVAP13_3KG056800 [Panicum virgatum]